MPADPFADVLPESPLRAARREDHARIARMLATAPEAWSDEDVDLVAFRAITTIGGLETFKWILPHFLRRTAAAPDRWMLEPDILSEKLDHAGFGAWPEAQRAAVLGLLRNVVAVVAAGDAGTLTAWLDARA
ncbi:hypothetical protein [Brevundimonas lenta]|uniref:Uncharacterized protein n=1 Tax=Brevundimonas lenta TaxID=424796 RepID=A0A7W6NP81_9CAUL|nr:hypothetical protein [Brevundimonas lenta]MBB4082608.1 hypothetical protein [Brevundimonas lenta]